MSQTFDTRTFWVASMICADYDVSLSEVRAWGKEGWRKPRMVKIRDAVISRLRSIGGHSYPNIGAALCLDHSAIIYAERREARRRARGGVE